MSKKHIRALIVSISSLLFLSMCIQVSVLAQLPPGPIPKPGISISTVQKLPTISSMCQADGQLYAIGGGKLSLLTENGNVSSSISIALQRTAGMSAYSAGQLLVGDPANRQLVLLDKNSGKTSSYLSLRSINTKNNPAGNVLSSGELSSVAFDGANVFIGMSAGYSSSVFKVDPKTKNILSHAFAPGPNPSAMTFSAGNLFVLDGERSAVRRFNANLLEPSEVVEIPSLTPKGLIVQGNDIMLLEQNTQIIKRVDASSIEKIRRVSVVDLVGKIDVAVIVQAMIPKHYAVLITGDRAESGFDEFWGDTCWMYKTLRNAGYAASDIFVLYGNGNDYISPNPFYRMAERVTDFPATVGWVNKVFDGLKNGDAAIGVPKLKTNDTLFVWTFDHGAGYEPPVYLCLMDGWMTDSTFAAKLNAIPYASRAIFMQQCFSGGFSNDLSNAKTFFSSACRGTEVAHRADSEKESVGGAWYHHGEYNYYIISALSGRTPLNAVVNADSNRNGFVSALEAHNWYVGRENQPEVGTSSNPGVGGNFNIKH